MILTGPAIKSAVKGGDVFLEPFDESNLNPNSYNYHLADSLLVLGLGGKLARKISLSSEGFVLIAVQRDAFNVEQPAPAAKFGGAVLGAVEADGRKQRADGGKLVQDGG